MTLELVVLEFLLHADLCLVPSSRGQPLVTLKVIMENEDRSDLLLGVFLLLDGVPAKANGPHLPGAQLVCDSASHSLTLFGSYSVIRLLLRGDGSQHLVERSS